MIIRTLVSIAIFAALGTYIACEIVPPPIPHRADASWPDAMPEPDSGPHGYFGREPIGSDVGP